MHFNLYNSLILAGIIQGFIFTVVVLLSKKYRAKSTVLLTALIFTYSLGNLQYIIADIGLVSLVDMYKYIYLPFASIIPVLIYFYVVKFLRPSVNIRKKFWWCLPFTLAMLVTLYYRCQFLLAEQQDVYFAEFALFVQGHEVFSVLFAIVLVILAIMAVRRVERHQIHANRKYFRADLKWLKFTLYFILLFTFIWAHLTYRNIFVAGDSPDFYLLWIGIAATIYWLGHIGIYKYGLLEQRKALRSFSETRTSHKTESNEAVPIIGRNTDNKYLIMLNSLLVNDKIYLDPSLSLDKVSELLHLSSSYLSRIIHKELNTHFSDYINTYRIEEAKRYLMNPEFSRYTITAIGLEAGFNSRSSFYDVFKKITGQTPSSFKKSLKHTKYS